MTSNKSIMKRISCNLDDVIKEVKKNRNLTSETQASWLVGEMFKKGSLNGNKQNKKMFKI